MQATLILGIAWAVWHLPTFAFPAVREGLEFAELGMVVSGALVEIVALALTGNATVLTGAVALVLLTRARLGQSAVRLATAGP